MTGHIWANQGVVKCREQARQTAWWPGINSQIRELVLNCRLSRECIKERVNPREPLLPTKFPNGPTLEILPVRLQPPLPDLQATQFKEKEKRQRDAKCFGERHRARVLTKYQVWVTGGGHNKT